MNIFGIGGRARINVVVKKSEYAAASTDVVDNMFGPRFKLGIRVIVRGPGGQSVEPNVNEISGDSQVHRYGTGTDGYESGAIPSQDRNHILGQPGEVPKFDGVIVSLWEPCQKAVQACEILC